MYRAFDSCKRNLFTMIPDTVHGTNGNNVNEANFNFV